MAQRQRILEIGRNVAGPYLFMSGDKTRTRWLNQFSLGWVFNETVISSKSKGNHSSAVCANWAGVNGSLATNISVLRVGLIQYLIRHAIRFPASNTTESKKTNHIFARMFWY